MTLATKILAYFYLVAVLHICGLQAYAFITNQPRIRVGRRFYRYQVYAVSIFTLYMLSVLFIEEVFK